MAGARSPLRSTLWRRFARIGRKFLFARGVKVVSARGTRALCTGGAAGRWPARARPCARHCGGDSRALDESSSLHAELKSFLHAVRERSAPVVPLEDGRRALALALDIVAAIRAHGKKVGLSGISKAKP